MKKKISIVLYFIIITIVVTIGIQLYWNYINFENNKRNIINDIQTSLEQSIDQYYIGESKKDIIGYMYDHKTNKHSRKSLKIMSLSYNQLELPKKQKNNVTVEAIPIKDDSVNIELQVLDQMAKKIVVSVFRENINLLELNKNLKKSLTQKKISIPYSFSHCKEDKKNIIFSEFTKIKYDNHVISKSNYLPKGSYIKLQFTDLNKQAYKASLFGILLSFLLCSSIIFCLIYLLRIINNQKQIAEIKNDFISNITHELKTPITVVSSAIEGIQHFNSQNDIEKTNKYLSISNQELGKLNQIVEKILEMATIESTALQLKKEPVVINDLIYKCISKAQHNTTKEILFVSEEIATIRVDVFHFENVFTNLIENAIKYGGNKIEIKVEKYADSIEIEIADNGKGISKSQHKKIFEKFYRIPTQNIHNVKGFGIGLYYVKQIVEKHQGIIEVIPNDFKTVFKISLPNDGKN